MENNAPIIISGMHRSGTSLLASYLEKCGLHVGDQLLEGDRNNAKGYFEQQPILEFQRQFLAQSIERNDVIFPDWGVGSLDVLQSIGLQYLKDAKIAAEKGSSAGIWGWKDPRSCLLHELWNKVYSDPKFVLVYREPWEVFRSIDDLKEDIFNKQPGLARAAWLQYNRAVLEIKDRYPDRCILVGTRALLRRSTSLIELMNEKWDLGLSLEGLGQLFSGDLMDSSIPVEYFEDVQHDEEVLELLKGLDQVADLPNNPPAIQDATVVITCFNDGRFLKEAVYSVKRSLLDVPIIIVNDGSSDPGTLEVLDELRRSGVQVIDQENLGLPAARNAGFAASETTFVLPVDADNRIDPFYLQQGVDALQRDPENSYAYADRRVFGDLFEAVRVGEVQDQEMLIGNRIDACAVIRKSAWQEVGGYCEELTDGYEDWDLWLSFIDKGFGRTYLSEFLFDYRVRKDSLLGKANDPAIRKAILKKIVARHQDLFFKDPGEIISGLHAIQAHDKSLRSAQLEELKIELEDRAQERMSVVEAEKAEVESRHEELQLRSDQLQRRLGEVQERLQSAEHTVLEERQLVVRAEKQIEELQSEVKGLQSEVDQIRLKNSELSEEAFRLVKELDAMAEALGQHRDYANGLLAQVQMLDSRIKEMEATKSWRLHVSYQKMRAVMRTSSGRSTKGFKWLKKAMFVVSRKGRLLIRKFFAKVFKVLYLWTEVKPVQIIERGSEVPMEQFHQDPYYTWMARNMARESDLSEYRDRIGAFEYQPKLSIVMPVYNPPIEFFEQAVQSIIDQIYENWELCIADDLSTDPKVRKALEEMERRDDRIKVVYRTENGHISKASNSGLEIAEGEFVVLMDHDDLITKDALYHNVKLLNKDRTLDLIYSDEDKVDDAGHFSDPHFKPQWCPDHLLSRNYFGHLVVLRTSIMKDIGGFRVGFEGSQDYDLMLRFTERTQKVAHIPKVLYRWRIHSGSAAQSEEAKPYAYNAARKALGEALERRGEPGRVDFLPGFRGYSIRFDMERKPKVSIVIPTKDQASVLQTCLTSIFEKTDYPDLEVVVVSNNSEEKATFDLLTHYENSEDQRFKWFELNEPFNFSKLMNAAVDASSGEHLLFLNNDTEVIGPDWVQAMVEQSQRPSIGAVGVKLLYHNDTIQHAGVLIGLGGAAGHTFVGYHKDGPGYFNYVNTINNYSAVTAACMMVSRDKFEKVGRYDELLTVEYNDVDLCLRLRESGLNNVYLPHVSMYHYESLSRGHPHMTKESYERHLREIKIFQDRWQKYIDDDPCYNPNLSRGVHDFQLQL